MTAKSMTLRDTYGAPIALGVELAHGGEAVVYRVHDRPEALAKIYAPPRPGYKQKLTWMRSNPPVDPSRAAGHASIAWPRELLYDGNGRFAGYLMPHVADAVLLLEVFNPRRRARTLPAFDRRYLHRTARNLASAVAALHRRGYVIGDLNQSNVLVTPRALITLIDTDSFQVQHIGETQIVTYPCPVGMVEYTPPELQGQSFRAIVRQPEHDCFGLAVLAFQLLMDGSHPFRGRWLGQGEPPPLAEKIAQGWFPYGAPPPKGLAPPDTAPSLAVLHPRLDAALRRCFIDGHANPRLRPSAEEWEQALGEAENDLVTCANGHLVAGHVAKCPVCGARSAKRRAASSPSARQPAPSGPFPTPVPAAAAAGVSRAAAVARAPVRFGENLVRSARHLAEEFTAAVVAVPAGLVALPRQVFRTSFQTALFVILAPFRPAATAQRLHRTRLTVTRAVLLALAGALSGAVAGLVLFALGSAAATAGAAGASLVASGSAVTWAALVGGMALATVAGFRDLDIAVGTGLMRGMVRRAILRGLAGAVGWGLGWIGASMLDRLLLGGLVPPAAWPVAANAIAWLPGWTLGWALFGAIGGASIGAVSERWASWAAVAGLFGVVGWLVVRLLAGVLVLTG